MNVFCLAAACVGWDDAANRRVSSSQFFWGGLLLFFLIYFVFPFVWKVFRTCGFASCHYTNKKGSASKLFFPVGERQWWEPWVEWRPEPFNSQPVLSGLSAGSLPQWQPGFVCESAVILPPFLLSCLSVSLPFCHLIFRPKNLPEEYWI